MPFKEALLFYEEALQWLDWQSRISALAYHAPGKLSEHALWRSSNQPEVAEQGWNALKGKFNKPKPPKK